MLIIDTIKVVWATRQAIKFEKEALSFRRTKFDDLKDWAKVKFETKKAKAARLAKEEEERKQFIKESNERIAALLRDPDNINFICDFIKKNELVDGYK